MLRYYRRAYLYQDDTVSGYNRSYSCRWPCRHVRFRFCTRADISWNIILPSGHNHERKSRDFTLVNLRPSSLPRVPNTSNLSAILRCPCAILILYHRVLSEYLSTLVSIFFPLKKSILPFKTITFSMYFFFFKIQIKIYSEKFVSISCIMSKESKR